MMSKDLVQQFRAVMPAQRHLLGRLRRAIDSVAQGFSMEAQRHRDLAELEQLVQAMEANAPWLSAGDLDGLLEDAIRRDAKTRRQTVKRDLERIGFTDWPSFVQQCEAYDRQQGLDPLLPYDSRFAHFF